MITPELAEVIAKASFSEPFRQVKPMTTYDFRKWLSALGFRFENWQTLHFLWQHGAVAPIAVTENAIEHTPGLTRDRFVPTVEHDGIQLLGDIGVESVALPELEMGWDDIPSLSRSLWWHPFQLYEFVGIEWTVQQNWSLDTHLRNVDEGFIDWEQQSRVAARERLASDANSPKHTEFRRLLALLLTIEPMVHGHIHGSISYGLGTSIEQYYEWRSESASQPLLERVGLTIDQVIGWHEELSIKAHLHDSVRELRILVHQIDPKRLAKTKGLVHRSQVLFGHAEVLRRHLEWTQGVVLLEEDDYIMREGHQRFKEDAFGSVRVYDGNQEVLRRIARYYGIDHSERVALLLEGPTEIAFFESVAEHWGIDLANRGIVLYDLKGKDGLDKNQILRQLLLTFQKHEIFVYAAFDEDGGGDHIRVLKQMASRGILSAGFSVWIPDFESHNFSLNELALTATILAQENGMDVKFTAQEIEAYMQERRVPAGTAIERIASRKRATVGKGAEWGRALARVVCANDVEVPKEIRDEKGDRPAFAMLGMLMRGHKADYTLSVEQTINQHKSRG